MQSKYDYDEVTIIKTTKPTISKFNALESVITGKSQSETDPSVWAYSVKINDVDECYFIFEEDLQPTGKKVTPDIYEPSDTVTVKVNPKTGEGYIDDEDQN